MKSIPIKIIRRWIHLFVTFVETSYLNTDICKFESSQKEEIRVMSADYLEVHSKPKAFNGCEP